MPLRAGVQQLSYLTTGFDTPFSTQPKLRRELHTFSGNRVDSLISLASPIGMPHHSKVNYDVRGGTMGEC